METIYTLTGWVKKIINNETAKVLEEIRMDAVGDLGKENLIQIAKNYLEVWNNRYPDKKRKYPIAYACSVFSNKVYETNGIIGRDTTVFIKLIKTGIQNDIKKTNGMNKESINNKSYTE